MNSISFYKILFASCVAALLLTACGGDDSSGSPEEPTDVVEPGCTEDADCEEGLVCNPYLADGAGECVVCIAGEKVCEGNGVKSCLPDGTGFGEAESCDDDDPCTEEAVCLSGSCLPAPPKTCDDENSCTTDLCNPSSGECLNLPNSDPGCCETDADCDDGLDCTIDTCQNFSKICINSGAPCSGFVGQWGGKGSGDGQLSNPSGIAVLASGQIAVADTGNNRISVFSREGVFSHHFDSEIPDGGLAGPNGMDVFSDGRVVVADTQNQRIVIYEADGTFSQVLLGEGQLATPTDVAVSVSESSIWVANLGANNIMELSLDDTVIRTHGEKGSAPGKFRQVRSIAQGSDGTLYTTDRELNRVQLLDPLLGDPLLIFGEYGSGPGQFDSISGIALTWTGTVVMADPLNKRIQFADGCTPACEVGAECGFNGCGGSCGGCLGSATCEEGLCVSDVDGGTGCFAGAAPGCASCECETCVCEKSAFCCDTAWDDLCVNICTGDCGGACADPDAEADTEPLLTYSSEIDQNLLNPGQIFVDKDSVLWIVDNVAAVITSFQLSP